MRRLAPALLVLVAFSAACNRERSTEGERDGRVGPASPGSAVLREIASSDAVPYEPLGGDNSCPTKVTSYGTTRAVEEVVEFFQTRGFARLGVGGFEDGRLVRWGGVREGDVADWRKVDIATGEIAGRPEWTTTYEVFAAACGTAPTSTGITPAPTAPLPQSEGSANSLPDESADAGISTANGCPVALPPGQGAEKQVVEAIRPEVHRVYSPGIDITDFEVMALTSLDQAAHVPRFELDHYRRRAAGQCGEGTANRSWVVFLSFPAAPDASFVPAVAYFVRTPDGWYLWFAFYPNKEGSGSLFPPPPS